VIIAASMLAQVPLSLWWTRHFWLYGEFTTRGSPSVWVPNYLWAAVVLIGMPAATILGVFGAPMKFSRTASSVISLRAIQMSRKIAWVLLRRG
jgi:hypothetical protein